jgi:hypothetical protein
MRRLLLIALLLAAGCRGGGTEPEEIPTLTGRWEGSISGVEATLTETDGQVSGSGSVPSLQGPVPITVTGTHTHPDVVLIIRSPEQPDGSFAGAFTGPNTVAGTLSLAGFPPLPLTLTRR